MDITSLNRSLAARRLLCVAAHPDDESLGMGGILARYAAEGVATFLVVATRGEYGWAGDASAYPGPVQLGELRTAELHAAARILGLREVAFLDYLDGAVDQADQREAVARVAAQLRRLRPQVVVTFGPEGATGHPDHIAISQITTSAIVCAADPCYAAGADAPHRVDKLYYLAGSRAQYALYDAIFGDSAMTVDGVKRRFAGWEEWALTTRVDTSAYWQRVWAAVRCHRSQLPDDVMHTLTGLPPEQQRALWGTQEFYRAFSLVNGGRAPEDDLFVGIG